MSKTKILEIARRYGEVLRKNRIPFEFLYLYGSYAKGNYHKDSDIDICVVSKDFDSKNWLSFDDNLWRLREDIDFRIEPLGMSLDDFNDYQSPMGYEVKTFGIKVY